MNKSKLKTGVIIAAAFISGVALAPNAVSAVQKIFDPSIKMNSFEDMNTRVSRFDDPDFQVKCWISDGDRSGGIACLPWKEVEER